MKQILLPLVILSAISLPAISFLQNPEEQEKREENIINEY